MFFFLDFVVLFCFRNLISDKRCRTATYPDKINQMFLHSNMLEINEIKMKFINKHIYIYN